MSGTKDVKYDPPIGNDSMIISGVPTYTKTRYLNITCMKEYENKSAEELRYEDYLASASSVNKVGMEQVVYKAPARYFVLKWLHDEDFLYSIQNNIWYGTAESSKKLATVWCDQAALGGGAVYLFYSKTKAQRMCGVAQMLSAVDYNTIPDKAWRPQQNQNRKGQFKVKWIHVKDIPNQAMTHIILEHKKNKPVALLGDAQEVPYKKGEEVMKIFESFKQKSSLLDKLPRSKVSHQAAPQTHGLSMGQGDGQQPQNESQIKQIQSQNSIETQINTSQNNPKKEVIESSKVVNKKIEVFATSKKEPSVMTTSEGTSTVEKSGSSKDDSNNQAMVDKTLDGTISDLKAELLREKFKVAKLSSQNNQQTKALVEKQDTIKSLTKQVEENRNEYNLVERLSKNIDKVSNFMKKVRNQFDSNKEVRNDLTTKLKNCKEKLAGNDCLSNQPQSRLSQELELLAKLSKEVNDKKTEKASLDDKLKEVQEEVSKHRTEFAYDNPEAEDLQIAHLKDTIQKQVKEINMLKESNIALDVVAKTRSTYDINITNGNPDKESCADNITENKVEDSSVDKSVELEEESSKKDEIINDLTIELKVINNEINELREAKKDHQISILKLENKIEIKDQNIKDLNDQVKRSIALYVEMEQKYSQLKEEISNKNRGKLEEKGWVQKENAAIDKSQRDGSRNCMETQREEPQSGRNKRELQCPFCKELMRSAVLLPCCTSSACHSCAREKLMENSMRCPICEEGNVLPDDLIPDRSVRLQVAGFKVQNEQRNAKRKSPDGEESQDMHRNARRFS